MQQFITSSEAHALLDRVLQTSQSLNAAIARFVHPVVAVLIPIPEPPTEALVQPSIVEEPTVLPEPRRPVAPVLTIKLTDLIRESRRGAAQQRRLKPTPPAKTRPRSPYRRPTPQVEVIYRRGGLRMVS